MQRSKRPWTRAEKSLFLVPFLLVVSAGAVWLWQQRGPKWIPVPNFERVDLAEFSPDSQRLIVAASNKNVTQHMVFNVASRSKVCTLQSVGFDVWPQWSPDGTRLVSGYDDGSVGALKIKDGSNLGFHFNALGKFAVWDAQSGRLLAKWPYASRNEDSFALVRFSKDGRNLIGEGQPPAIFSALSGARLRGFSSSFATTGTGNFSPNQDLLAIKDRRDDRLEVRDTRDNQVLWQPDSHNFYRIGWAKNNILGIQCDALPHKDGSRTRVLLWDANQRQVLPSPPSQHIFGFALNNTAPLVAVTEIEWQDTNTLRIKSANLMVWDYKKESVVWNHKMQGRLFSLAWSADGRWLAVVEEVSSPRVWIFNAQGQVKRQLQYQVSSFNLPTARWAPDSKQLAITRPDGVQIIRTD